MSRSSRSVESWMSQLDIGGSKPPSQLASPEVFRDGRAARPNDAFIAVMGVTGSGKSSFISLCCKKKAKIGHHLNACTTHVDVYAYELSPEQTVYLIDTPGFDDTNRTDTEVLREIASWLTTSYSNKVLLHGIIYLHRITDVRMQGSAKKNLNMFKQLCGDNALPKVILTTTMWDKVDETEGEYREKQLIDTPKWWGYMVGKGSQVYRHDNTASSARAIIKRLARGNSRVTLDLQNQLVNEKRDLIDTGAGRELESELIKERERWAKELKEVREQMTEALRDKDKESAEALQEVKEDYKSRMKQLEKQNKRLHVNSEKLYNERIEKLEKALLKQQKEHLKEIESLRHRTAEVRKQELRSLEAPIVSSTQAKPTPAVQAQNKQLFSLSLVGDNFALDGPKHVFQACMSTEAFAELKTVTNALCFLVCGTNSSWVYKYRTATGGYYVKWSGNLSQEYPFLCGKLQSELATRELNYLSLGPNQYFYSKWANYNWWCLPKSVENKIQEVTAEGITAVTLGMDESYVIVHGNRWSWDLKGYYSGLLSILKESKSTPRAVAINCQNRTDYMILLGTMGYSLTGRIGNELHGTFLDWKTRNQV